MPVDKQPRHVPASSLGEPTRELLRDLEATQEPAYITEEGRPAAVVMTVAAYAKVVREREVLAQLARGEKDIAENRGHDLEEVLAEVEEELRRA